MHIHLPALSGIVLTYLLVFSRVGAMIMLLPGLGTMGVPARVRLVLALAVAFALTPVVQAHYPAVAPQTVSAWLILIGQEITAGVLVGAMAAIIMSRVAGGRLSDRFPDRPCLFAKLRSQPEHPRRRRSAISSRCWARC